MILNALFTLGSSEMCCLVGLSLSRTSSRCLKMLRNYHKIEQFPGSSTVERSAVNRRVLFVAAGFSVFSGGLILVAVGIR